MRPIYHCFDHKNHQKSIWSIDQSDPSRNFMYTRTRNRVRGGTEHVVTVKELDDYHLFRLFSFQGDDVTGLSLSLLQ